MSETKKQGKRTPGPWIHDDTNEHYLGDFIRMNGICIAKMVQGQTADEEREANARLIAAAPELLKACIAARAFIPKNQEGVRNFVNAAIAKAEGRS